MSGARRREREEEKEQAERRCKEDEDAVKKRRIKSQVKKQNRIRFNTDLVQRFYFTWYIL